MDDNSVLQFGKHKGKKLANIPASYLLWLYENVDNIGELATYVKENMQGLLKEIEKEKISK